MTRNLIFKRLLVLLVFASVGVAEARIARFAIVIGWNQSDDSDLVPLRYADDDAVKYAQLMDSLADKTILLAGLDADTRRTFGQVSARRPTRKAVAAALSEIRHDMMIARARGDDPVLFFVYSGHGNYDQEGRGYVHLADGRFTTRDLYYDVLGPTMGAQPHHVVLVVDACNAALLVNSRGGDRRRARRSSLRLEDYPRVGVILSASSVGEVHEWGRFLSGIFSHEVRSALLGAGDLDGDGEVDFAELAAFVANANAEVKNEVYRIRPYIRPPLDRPNMPLVSRDEARFRARVDFEADFVGRAHLVDDELVRYADFHKAPGQGLWLGVPGQGEWRVVTPHGELRIPAEAEGVLRSEHLEAVEAPMVSSRGTDEYFEKRLFARPWRAEAARDWLQDRYAQSLVVERFERVPWYENGAAWSLFGAGVGALGGAAAFHVMASGAAKEARRSTWADDTRRLNESVETNMTAAWALYGVGGAALVSSVVWFAVDERFRTSRYVPPLAVDVGPGGVQLRTSF